MRGVLFIAAWIAACLFSAGANAQPVPCNSVHAPSNGAAFLIDEDGGLVQSIFRPTVYVTAKPEASFRVCIPIPGTGEDIRSVGAANIRVQFYNALENIDESPDVEYYNSRYDDRLIRWRDELRRKGVPTSVDDQYFSTSIARYQEFHGCGGPFAPLENDFHMDTARGRTDAAAVRQKFLFSRDVSGQCGLLSLFDGFRRLFDWGVGFRALAADLYDFPPDEDHIARRRSVIVSFDARGDQPTFASYLVEHVGVGKCIRVESTLIFDADQGSDVEFACVGPK